ncbi:MAG: hypothetical protein N2Z79_04240, partial [Candidatus Omnitrophica bacterium]|nr:hypothetical protein [Candidatus Omnitrophota bacterium]
MSRVFSGLKTKYVEARDFIVERVRTIGISLFDFSSYISNIKKRFSIRLKSLVENIKDLSQVTKVKTEGFLSNIKSTTRAFLDDFIQTLKKFFNQNKDFLRISLENCKNYIKNKFKGLIRRGSLILQRGGETLRKTSSTAVKLGEGILLGLGSAKTSLHSFKEYLEKFAAKTKEEVTSFSQRVKEYFQGVKSKIKAIFGSLIQSIKTLFHGFRNLGKAILNALKNLKRTIVNFKVFKEKQATSVPKSLPTRESRRRLIAEIAILVVVALGGLFIHGKIPSTDSWPTETALTQGERYALAVRGEAR